MKSISVAIVTSPPVRVSFPEFLKPKRYKNNPEAPAYYSGVLMIDKLDKEQMIWMKIVYAAAQKILVEQWPDESKRPRTPLHSHTESLIKDGDTTCNRQGVPLCEKNPEYAGHWIIRAASDAEQSGPLPVVDKSNAAVMSAAVIYAGCKCRININVYGRTRADNPGVSAGLNGVQKWEDCERFGAARPAVEDMFGASQAEDPANYGGDPFGGGQQQQTQGSGDPFAGAADQSSDYGKLNSDGDIPF